MRIGCAKHVMNAARLSCRALQAEQQAPLEALPLARSAHGMAVASWPADLRKQHTSQEGCWLCSRCSHHHAVTQRHCHRHALPPVRERQVSLLTCAGSMQVRGLLDAHRVRQACHECSATVLQGPSGRAASSSGGTATGTLCPLYGSGRPAC